VVEGGTGINVNERSAPARPVPTLFLGIVKPRLDQINSAEGSNDTRRQFLNDKNVKRQETAECQPVRFG
tara:strand:- start:40 stop:246 length:207 start_codon:yes stop_codon:yes gene_type:complete